MAAFHYCSYFVPRQALATQSLVSEARERQIDTKELNLKPLALYLPNFAIYRINFATTIVYQIP
jgi:hypothetical protein